MKKLLSILFITSLLVSCSSKGGDEEIIELSDNNTITEFSILINNETVQGVINQDNRRIDFDVRGADVTSLTPTISIPAGATVSPSSGTTTNFSNPVTYRVTAENGDERNYTVTVNNTPFSTEKDITSFSAFIGSTEHIGIIEEMQGTIYLNPGNIDLTSFTLEIEISEYATVDPASGTTQNLEGPMTFTVTAEDGSTKEYTLLTNEPEVFGISGYVGPQPQDILRYYSGAVFTIDGDNLSFSFGEKLFISDGTNQYDLEVLSTQQSTGGMNSFESRVKIPESVPTGVYDVFYQRGSYIKEHTQDFDIDQNTPVVNSTNQTSYFFNDQMVITGQNLTPAIIIPSNGSLYVINAPSSTYNYMLSPDGTTITLDLGNNQLFPSYYGNSPEVKNILLVGDGGRYGPSFQVTFN